ncbi:MAG: flagellar biosynthetic protein FliR [Gammaproteobacteria bacterium]|jgi:flagellar biosynthetic protein FliR
MTLSADQLTGWMAGLYWPFIRIAAMLVAAPLFGARTVPVRVVIALALVLTWAIHDLIPPVPSIDPFSLSGLLVTGYQVLIGAAMGFVLHMVFSALVMAGEAVGLSMGLGFATLVDPQNGVQVPVVSQYYLILGTLLFLALNGHLFLIEMAARSFRSLPVGTPGLNGEVFWQVARWGGQMFAAGLLVALPAVASLLLVNLAFGVITRAAPQLNIFAVGFPITLVMGFALILLSLPTLVPRFGSLLTNTFELMGRVAGM